MKRLFIIIVTLVAVGVVSFLLYLSVAHRISPLRLHIKKLTLKNEIANRNIESLEEGNKNLKAENKRLEAELKEEQRKSDAVAKNKKREAELKEKQRKSDAAAKNRKLEEDLLKASVVGSYDRVVVAVENFGEITRKVVLFEDGWITENGKLEGIWKIVGKEVHIHDATNGNVLVLKIEPNGNLTAIAKKKSIRNKRTELSKEYQRTYKKLKE